MIPPHELNNKEFSRVVRGYSIPEVDEYISYLKEKYTELYRENDTLLRRLQEAGAELDELKAEESDIRAALITAQKAGKKIITDANTRAGRITMQTKVDCDTILERFRRESAQERETLAVLKGQVANLKQRLFEMYSSHISMIEQITPNINEEMSRISAISDDEYAASLAAEIRGKSGVDEAPATKSISDEELAALAKAFGEITAEEQLTPQPPLDTTPVTEDIPEEPQNAGPEPADTGETIEPMEIISAVEDAEPEPEAPASDENAVEEEPALVDEQPPLTDEAAQAPAEEPSAEEPTAEEAPSAEDVPAEATVADEEDGILQTLRMLNEKFNWSTVPAPADDGFSTPEQMLAALDDTAAKDGAEDDTEEDLDAQFRKAYPNQE